MQEVRNSNTVEITEERAERVVLAAVEEGITESTGDMSHRMDELASLAKACYMEPVGVIIQRLETVNKGLYMGAGKVQELKELCVRLEADLVVFNNSLTPSQLRNLQDLLDVPVMDRTTLILEIFESRARTREARLQVETAKLQYLLPRLVGMHEALTRQGGTSGSMSSRGAGEKKLELDRRKIEHRIAELQRELKEITKEREVQRSRRNKGRLPLVSLVGYTNAGKSTIMNAMVDRYAAGEEKRVLEKDMLFATLDTSIRRINTGDNRDFLLSDTVGFIHDLPHSLVKAFRSTLEEIENADLLIQVVDYSDPFYEEQMKTTAQTLTELSTGHIPMLTVYNKADRREGASYPRTVGDKLFVSAKEEASLDLLVGEILKKIYADQVEGEFLIPFQRGDIVSYFMENAVILKREYQEEGTLLLVKCHPADREKYRSYLTETGGNDAEGKIE